MITTRFNTNILVTARKFQGKRTTATPTGDPGERLSSARLADYENQAIRRILLENYIATGSPAAFAEKIPWYVKTTLGVVFNGTSAPLPADGWMVESITTPDGKKFRRALQHQVAGILSGTERILVPTADEPVFWQEENSIFFRPSLSAEAVVVRYIRRHEDLAVLDSPSTSGRINLIPGTFTVATRTIVVNLNAALTVADVNKPFSFYDGLKVYDGFILSVTNGTTFTAGGDALPAADAAVATILISDVSPGEILLPDTYDPQIVAYMIEAAQTDHKLNQ